MRYLQDLELAESPAVAPIAVEDAKAHLRIFHADDDDLIEGFIAAAVDHLDGPAGVLGRCLVEQAWTLHLPRFPCAGVFPWARVGRTGIKLPLPPLIGVDEIVYLDVAGAVQTLSPSVYQVLAGERAEIHLVAGQSWPLTYCHPRAIGITFRCGFAAAGGTEESPTPPDAADVPAALRAAIKLMVGDLYENREAQTIAGGTLTVIENKTVERLIKPKRLPRV